MHDLVCLCRDYSKSKEMREDFIQQAGFLSSIKTPVWQVSHNSLRCRAQATAVHCKRVLSGKRDNPNAERDCHRSFKRWGCSLPLPIESVDHEVGKNVETTAWVKVSTWLDYLLKRVPSVLGIHSTSLQEQCQTFWTLFRYDHPDHVVFTSNKDLKYCLPLNLYGDEGRGPKRAQYLELTFETPFGVFEHTESCNCSDMVVRVPSNAKPDCGNCDPLPGGIVENLSTNLKAHSYITKHLIFGLPSYKYKEHPCILDTHLRLLAEDMQQLYHDGLLIRDQRWFGVLVGVKGDMKFHSETICTFTRCHSNLGRKQSLMMCPFCYAGSAAYPFEEVDHDPAWAESLMMSRPWEISDTPQLALIPFDSFGRQEGMFRLDLFHLLKVGLSRDVAGSLVVIYCRTGLFDADEDSRDFGERLTRAHGSFRLWCLENHKSPGLRSFTRAFFNVKSFAGSPWANSKGSDTTLLLRWLLWFTGLKLVLDPEGMDSFLKTAKTVTSNILGLHQLCETHGLFLDRACAQMLYAKMLTVAKGYHLLARHALGFGMVGFGLKPKYHGLKHMAHQLKLALQAGAPKIVNPNYCNCESNEDHVGKVSSLARKVSTRTIGHRVIQRYFLKTRALFDRHVKAFGKGKL